MALIHGKVSIEKLSKEFRKADLNFQKENLDKNFDFKGLSIEFKDVSFNYPKRQDILSNLNLKIFKNTIIGIKGETGSGKSTFIKLIMNLLEPSSGKISIDNLPLTSIRNAWQKKISYIPQNFYILDDTFLENILFSEDKKQVEINKVNQILKFCHLDNLVKDLPEGLNTIVGPSGKLLSGGQAQRLAMARGALSR